MTDPRRSAAMEWQGPFAAAEQGSHRVLASRGDWERAWAEIGQAAPPPPDFQTHFAVAVFLGLRRTGGYGVLWLEPSTDRSATTVRYRVSAPTGMAMQVITRPFAVKVFPRTPGGIIVAKEPER